MIALEFSAEIVEHGVGSGLIGTGYVNKLEAGRYDPTVGTLTRIAKALGMAMAELLE